MKVAFGIKAHSGWAALVVLGTDAGRPQVVSRSRMDLIEHHGEPASSTSWAKQPYHAAQRLMSADARALVERGISSARRMAVQEMQHALTRTREAGHNPIACAVLMSEPMPDWTVDEILAVHFRMHKAEGVLFRDALARAAESCGIRLLAIREKQLDELAERTLKGSSRRVRAAVTSLGRSIGPPWGRDQKEASLAAILALAR
jgi:hypothetical protein